MSLAYFSLNMFMLMLAIVLFRVSVRWPDRRTWLALAGIFLLTAIFDNVMIAIGAFAYDVHSILGVKIGLAPVEDFFYPLVAVMAAATIWQRTSKRGD